MRKSIAVVAGVVVACLLEMSAAPARAQEGGRDALAAARNQVAAELAASLPHKLPDGALAILPPAVPNRELVDGEVSTSWTTAFGEALHRVRPDIIQADRAHLDEVLREQKLGDSAYADPTTAARVGKLVAARMLLMTRLHEFRLDGGTVRVSLEASLVDVETGENLWAKAYTRGIFPFWAKAVLLVLLLAVVAVGWRVWRSRRLRGLVRRKLPREKEELRVDVNGLARAVSAAREALHGAGAAEGARAVQGAWSELDPVLDRVRHALPGGAVDRSRIRDVKGAVRAARRIQEVVAGIRRECELAPRTDNGGRRLAETLRSETASLQAALDDYRRHLA